MGKSYRRTPIFGHTTSISEKSDKKRWHRAFRRASKQSPEALHYPDVRANSNPWSMAKDGKRYFRGATDKDMRR